MQDVGTSGPLAPKSMAEVMLMYGLSRLGICLAWRRNPTETCREPSGQQGVWHETHRIFAECSTVRVPVKYLQVLQKVIN